MTKEEIEKAFEGRWWIKAHLDDTGHVKGTIGGYTTTPEQLQAIKELCRDFFEAGIILADKECVTNPPEMVQVVDFERVKQVIQPAKTPIELRSESFRVQVFSPENITVYPKEMLSEFYDYWSEPNRSNTKLRYEGEKTWDLSRRLKRWAKNDYSGYVRKQQSSDSAREKLASILTD